MSSIKPIVHGLETIFQQVNERFFGGRLDTPVITVNYDTTSGAYGWASCWKAWVDGSDKGYYELNMCAEHLNRPIGEIVATMLHECVHLWNLQNDIKDTSRGNTYHNKRFKSEAEQRGLHIEQDKKYGWTITTLNEDGIEFLNSIDDEVFGLHRTPMSKSEKSKSKKKSSSRKYICPNCQQSIRATKELKVLCGECSTEDNLVLMECEDAEGEDK